MRKRIFGVLMAVMIVALAPVVVGAADLSPICSDPLISVEQKEAAGCMNTGDELENRIPGIVSAILWIAGALAVGMIIYAGVRMVISQGDASKVAQERQTIQYAIIGLIITILAYVIVGFISGQFTSVGDDGAGADSSGVVEEDGADE